MKKARDLPLYYFTITYVITTLLTTPSRTVEKYRVVFWVMPFCVWMISFLVNLITKDVLIYFWISESKIVNYYFLWLVTVMIVTNLFSVNIIYSLYSSLFSVFLLAMMFNVIGRILIKIDSEPGYKKLISIQLLYILVFAILGNIFISSWDWDSTIRFSGGLNPNMMALLSLFCFIWFVDLKLDNIYPAHSILGICLSIVILFWTLSRGRIIAFIFLIFYLVITIFFVLINPKLKYKFRKDKAMLNGMLGILLILVTSCFVYIALNNQNVSARLLTSISIDLRKNAWKILEMGFKNNILFGSFGWWNANKILAQYSNLSSNTASSSHNFYLRVLSEVGIIGLIALMIFPIGIFLKALKLSLFNKNIDKKRRKKLLLYSGAILAFFITQLVEDQYMQGIGDFKMGLFLWILTSAYYLTNEKLMKSKKVFCRGDL